MNKHLAREQVKGGMIHGVELEQSGKASQRKGCLNEI